ncbi:helix-turn-helix domain-containing protein [Anaerofustis stercorihominis]|uniref:Transcriptional regulator, Cro/CI family n=2 Tax=Anaerofustis stercorihominis TaxID=214853 RepID=B1CB07_9FIRM|nr:helix-turn-helix transcriptional regulator [Anaerofustis stercorihominis]EDS71454.1 transcriptional regulator, Cro/CI family [Anaerofustis stercorihominis DSM 17244]MCQ4795406.1 helix-turn-helix domain-containing protein [Anaerofustis stercorihominis]RGD75545.1 XRE family transcriptional regulator [Anaerofustis stercorihominis]
MNLRKAVTDRIKELCRENHMSINAMANMCGMPPSTIYSIMKGKSQNPCLNTVYHICLGMNMPLSEFFDSPIFSEYEDI